MSDHNKPYSIPLLTDITNDTMYITDIKYEIASEKSFPVNFYAEIYNKYGTVIYPVRTNYNSFKIDMEACENDKFTPYPIKYELLYQSNGKYIKIDEVTTSTGKASFKNLIKDYTYYIKAIDLSGKYLSKVVKYIPTEYDLSAQPTILIPYANYSYDKFQYNFIITNIIGEKYVYLENNNNHIKLEKTDDKRYIISLSEIKNRADEFDLVVEDHRENEIIKIVKHIYINDGYSSPYELTVEFKND